MTPEQFMAAFGAIAEAPGGIDRLRSKILEMAVVGYFGSRDASQVSLGSIFTFRQDLIRPTDETDAHITFVGPEHIEKNTGKRNGEVPLHASELKGRKFRFSPGEIVYTYLRPYLNKVWVATMEGVCSVDQYVLQVDSKRADVHFVRYAMLSPQFVAEAERLTHSLQLPRLRSKLLACIDIPLPPLAEQKRIVAKVDQLMAMLDDLEQRQEKKRTAAIHVSKASLDSLVNAEDPDQLARAWERVSKHFGVVAGTIEGRERLRATILDLGVAGLLGTGLPSDGDPENIIREAKKLRAAFPRTKEHAEIMPSEIVIPYPGHWRVARLDNICRFIDYRGQTPEKVGSGVRLITAKNVRMGSCNVEPQEYIREEDYESWMTRGYPTPGDVLLTTEAPLGNVAQLFFTEPVALAQRIITLHPLGGLNPRFLMYTIMAPRFQRKLADESSGVTARGIKAARLKTIVVPVPPPEEQDRIVSHLDRLIELLEEVESTSIRAMDAAVAISSAVAQSE